MNNNFKEDILVITPTLGNRNTLWETIKSVKEIGGNRVKHIIVCPESKIEDVKSKYKNISCLAEPNDGKGIYAALNHGFRTYGHKYKYLAFLNDDDRWLNNYKKLIETLDSDSSLDMVYGRTCYVNEKFQKIGSQSCSNQFTQFITLLQKNIVLLTQQAALIRSDLYFKIGGFDESYKLVADTKFWAQASLLDIKVKYVNMECAAYMIQDGQLSSDHRLQKCEHERLLNEIDRPSHIDNLAYLKYRISNTLLYIKRLCFSN